MSLPDFSVLLLAWDDADPGVAVLGGAALPPTQHLVYELAAQHPVLAVYPHLPAEAPAQPRRRAQKPAGPAPLQATDATKVAEPGVRLLPALALPRRTAGSTPASRMVGLYDLTANRKAQPQAVLGPTAAAAAVVSAPIRSQWPSAPNPAHPHPWQAPAAPYLGASPAIAPAIAPATVPAPPAATPVSVLPRLARPLWSRPPALRPNLHPLAGDLNFDPDPELPTLLRRTAFDEPTEEIGPAEAADLSAPEDDLVLDALAGEPGPPLPAEPLLPVPPMVLLPDLDGLNFRMIQYARRAAQLVRDRRDFGVIYAPNWPAWLAALEIRNSSGRPLVLYAAALATDTAAPAERGWLQEVERMALRRATLILVPDERLRNCLRAQYGATIGEIRVVAATDEPRVQRVLAEVAKAKA